MLLEIYNNIIYFLKLTGNGEVLWAVLPLALATIVMIVYFQKYKQESAGWNDYVANSLVLLFVSMMLLRQIYQMGILGVGNYIEYPGKTISVIFLLLIGMIIVRFNFEHLLPRSISHYISSPLTVNLIGFIIILFVHSKKPTSGAIFLSLLILFLFLFFLFHLIKTLIEKMFQMEKKASKTPKFLRPIVSPFKKFFRKLKILEDQEQLKEVKQEKLKINEMKKELKVKEKNLTTGKIKELEKKKKQATRLEKLIRKVK